MNVFSEKESQKCRDNAMPLAVSIILDYAKLTNFEKNILIIISEAHTFSIREVEMVYKRCKSFDDTIKILEESQAYSVDLTYKLTEFGY